MNRALSEQPNVEVLCLRCSQWIEPTKAGTFPQHPSPSGRPCSGGGKSSKTDNRARVRMRRD